MDERLDRVRYKDEQYFFKNSKNYLKDLAQVCFKEEGDGVNGVIEEEPALESPVKPREEVIEITGSDDYYIEDHTGVKRKAFKFMHAELKAVLKDKIVIAHNLPRDFNYLRLTRHDCKRTVDTSLIKMFQRKNLRRKLKELILEFIDEQIQKTVNHSPIEDAKACMRLFKVYCRELKIYPVKIHWNELYGSKEARFTDPPDFKEDPMGPFADLFKQDYMTPGPPVSHVGVAFNWAVND